MSKRTIFDSAERERQLKRLRTMEDEEIDTSDPDARVLSEEKWASARPFHETFRPRKTAINLRVDNDVLDYFKQKGEGYQTRINEALREKMNRDQQRAKSGRS